MNEPLYLYMNGKRVVSWPRTARDFEHLCREALPESRLYDSVATFNPGTYIASAEEIAEAVKNTLDEARYDMEHHPERLPR